MSETVKNAEFDDNVKTVRLGPRTIPIPDDWETVPFEEAIELNPRYDKSDDGPFDFLPMDAVNEETQTIDYWNQRQKDDCTTTWFKNGDTVYAKITPCTENGKIAFISDLETEVGSGSTEFLVFHARDGITNERFVYYLANMPDFRAVTISLMEGSTGRQRVPSDVFAGGLHVPLPPLAEQRRIADILSTVDEQIQQINKTIELRESLKKGLIQDIFQTGVYDYDVSKKYIGPKQITAPKEWSVCPLGDLCTVKNGTRVPKNDSYSESITNHPFVRISDMNNGSVSKDDIKYISKETASDMSRGQVSGGEVYITVTGRIGDAGIIPKDIGQAYLTDNAATLTSFEDVTREYIVAYLRSKLGQDEVHRLSIGSTQPKLSIYRVKKLNILVPPLREQEKITDILNQIQCDIESEIEMKNNLKELKRGLMQDLLTGTKRVDPKQA